MKTREQLIKKIKEWERDIPGDTDFNMGQKAAYCRVLEHIEAEEKEEDVPDEVAHFALYRHNDDSAALYLSNVFVNANERGNGYGNSILTMAEAAARSVGAWCIILKAKKGSDAVNWYARHGFTEIEDVGEFVWMRKNISNEKDVGVENVQIRKMEA